MADLPGVTVCLTHFKEDYATLHRAVMSVHAQTVQPWQILVIDDGGHMSREDEDSLDSEGIPVYRITNRGLPAARNTGLMLCETEGIVFLDADDWLDPTYIEKTLPVLQAGADVVLTGLQEHGPHRNGTYFPGYDKPFNLVSRDDMVRMNRFYYASLLRARLIKECGGYNPLMAGPWGQHGGKEDQDLWIDLMGRGARFEEVHEVLFHYDTSNPVSMAHTMNQAALDAEIRRHHRLD